MPHNIAPAVLRGCQAPTCCALARFQGLTRREHLLLLLALALLAPLCRLLLCLGRSLLNVGRPRVDGLRGVHCHSANEVLLKQLLDGCPCQAAIYLQEYNKGSASSMLMLVCDWPVNGALLLRW